LAVTTTGRADDVISLVRDTNHGQSARRSVRLILAGVVVCGLTGIATERSATTVRTSLVARAIEVVATLGAGVTAQDLRRRTLASVGHALKAALAVLVSAASGRRIGDARPVHHSATREPGLAFAFRGHALRIGVADMSARAAIIRIGPDVDTCVSAPQRTLAGSAAVTRFLRANLVRRRVATIRYGGTVLRIATHGVSAGTETRFLQPSVFCIPFRDRSIVGARHVWRRSRRLGRIGIRGLARCVFGRDRAIVELRACGLGTAGFNQGRTDETHHAAVSNWASTGFLRMSQCAGRPLMRTCRHMQARVVRFLTRDREEAVSDAA
jgi:hypothetical protein